IFIEQDRVGHFEELESFRFDFCIGSEEESPVENLGQVLFGERIRPSPYNISFLQSQSCSKVCTKTYTNTMKSIEKLLLLKRGMGLNYQHHWIVDNMPVTFCFNNQQDVKVCTTGFPMGCYVDSNGQPRDACVMDPRFNQPDSYYIFNHVDISIEYRDMTTDQNFLDEEQVLVIFVRSVSQLRRHWTAKNIPFYLSSFYTFLPFN
uniref:Transmembrane 9 superfamily member n=1 Tax=Angiostrongylus cantonensis TaxID=6313 RepID=A0A0K0D5T1_ANGCA